MPYYITSKGMAGCMGIGCAKAVSRNVWWHKDGSYKEGNHFLIGEYCTEHGKERLHELEGRAKPQQVFTRIIPSKEGPHDPYPTLPEGWVGPIDPIVMPVKAPEIDVEPSEDTSLGKYLGEDNDEYTEAMKYIKSKLDRAAIIYIQEHLND
jgi:hypothetical protein